MARRASNPSAVYQDDDCPCGSGKSFSRCHGADEPEAAERSSSTSATAADTPAIANIMSPDRSLGIATRVELDSLTGRQIERGGAVFELGSILRTNPEGVVYEARETRTGRSDWVLKVYRFNLSEEQIERKQAAHRECAEILGEGFLEAEIFRVGEWAVMLQRRAVDAVSAAGGALPDERAQPGPRDRLEEMAGRLEIRFREVAELIDGLDFAKAVQKCDEALEEFVLNPYFLLSKGIALLAMGEGTAAGAALDLCFEVYPHDAERYVAISHACAKLGKFTLVRKWAQEGARRALDRAQIYRAWFEAEEAAECVELSRLCLGQLRLLEEPETTLGSCARGSPRSKRGWRAAGASWRTAGSCCERGDWRRRSRSLAG
jgi:tetratricopeptide (TPR) repeat protein